MKENVSTANNSPIIYVKYACLDSKEGEKN